MKTCACILGNTGHCKYCPNNETIFTMGINELNINIETMEINEFLETIDTLRKE